MRIAQEEVFGPVLAVIKFKDEGRCHSDRKRHRVRPWRRSMDPIHQARHKMPKRIWAGSVRVNIYRAVSFMMPFGAIRLQASGGKMEWRRSRATSKPRAYGSTPGLAEAIHSVWRLQGRAAAALISRRDERIACTVLSQKART
jgi:hypothetical protein